MRERERERKRERGRSYLLTLFFYINCDIVKFCVDYHCHGEEEKRYKYTFSVHLNAGQFKTRTNSPQDNLFCR